MFQPSDTGLIEKVSPFSGVVLAVLMLVLEETLPAAAEGTRLRADGALVGYRRVLARIWKDTALRGIAGCVLMISVGVTGVGAWRCCSTSSGVWSRARTLQRPVQSADTGRHGWAPLSAMSAWRRRRRPPAASMAFSFLVGYKGYTQEDALLPTLAGRLAGAAASGGAVLLLPRVGCWGGFIAGQLLAAAGWPLWVVGGRGGWWGPILGSAVSACVPRPRLTAATAEW